MCAIFRQNPFYSVLPVTNPLARSARLTGLLPLTEYRVSARASTRCYVEPCLFIKTSQKLYRLRSHVLSCEFLQTFMISQYLIKITIRFLAAKKQLQKCKCKCVCGFVGVWVCLSPKVNFKAGRGRQKRQERKAEAGRERQRQVEKGRGRQRKEESGRGRKGSW